jgi:hypothetical protein
MLTPSQRIKAVAILATNAVNDLQARSYFDPNNAMQITDLQRAFEIGFPGFASYADKELVRGLHQIRSTNYLAQQLLETLAEDILLK